MAVELRLPCLCLVADCSVVCPEEIAARVEAAVAGGVSLVQLRAKEMPGGTLLTLAAEVLRVIKGRAVLLVNERVDVAAVASADGVQLGEHALPGGAARQLLPAGSLIGRSVHSVKGAVKAASEGVDLLVVGTMFATRSHPGENPAGPGLVKEISTHCSLPLIGIGGITADNQGEVMAAGASGVAVIRSILTADDPRLAAREMMVALRASWPESHQQNYNVAEIRGGQTP